MKILCILGKAGAGKDFITHQLLVNTEKYKKAVSYTTRPKRIGEKEGYDYFFINNDVFHQMLEQSMFLEKTTYIVNEQEWNYGYGIDSFDENFINIVIINPIGFKELLQSPYKKYISALYITANDDVRFERYINRNPEADRSELAARIKRDETDFKDIQELLSQVPYRVFNNNLELPSEEIQRRLQREGVMPEWPEKNF